MPPEALSAPGSAEEKILKKNMFFYILLQFRGRYRKDFRRCRPKTTYISRIMVGPAQKFPINLQGFRKIVGLIGRERLWPKNAM